MENKMSKYTPPKHGMMFMPEYQTRSGRAVRISFVEGDMIYGHVARKNDPRVAFHWEGCRWAVRSGFAVDQSKDVDLVDIPTIVVGWVNIYTQDIHRSFELAQAWRDSDSDCVACIPVEYTEGEYI
jgi:hypothetical protein